MQLKFLPYGFPPKEFLVAPKGSSNAYFLRKVLFWIPTVLIVKEIKATSTQNQNFSSNIFYYTDRSYCKYNSTSSWRQFEDRGSGWGPLQQRVDYDMWWSLDSLGGSCRLQNVRTARVSDVLHDELFSSLPLSIATLLSTFFKSMLYGHHEVWITFSSILTTNFVLKFAAKI